MSGGTPRTFMGGGGSVSATGKPTDRQVYCEGLREVRYTEERCLSAMCQLTGLVDGYSFIFICASFHDFVNE
jgi:hypothetical protein